MYSPNINGRSISRPNMDHRPLVPNLPSLLSGLGVCAAKTRLRRRTARRGVVLINLKTTIMSALVKTAPQAIIKPHPATVDAEETLDAFVDIIFELALASVSSDLKTQQND